MRLLPPLALLACAISTPTVDASIPRACSSPEHQQFAFCNASLSTAERVEDLLRRLPLDEKVTLLTARASPKGNMSSIGLPEYNWGANCVHGVQSTCGTNCATSFPNPVNLGAIFDPRAVFDMAQVVGWELRALWLEGARENYATGPHLGLDCWSPNININRDPRWGRNMETPSEDPLVNSKYGVAYTKGLQEGKDKRFLQAVVTLKHYAAYSYEHYDGIDRMAFNAVVSRYDFADTYLPAFEASVVHGKAKGVMCSYNSVNGMPMCANEQLNSKLLRDALGFDGYITSDSGAIAGIYHQRHYTKTLCEAGRLAILSGTDVNSGSVYKQCLAELVTSGQLPEKAVDDAMRRTLKLRFELGLFDPIDDQPYWHVAPNEVNTAESKQLSLDLSRKSIVLLQNHGNILPLAKGKKLAVIGPHAAAKRALLGNYLGQMCHGDYLEVGCVQTPLEAITIANGASNTLYAKGSGINDTSTGGFDEAEAAARKAETVVLFLGIDTSIEREAWDRENIDMPNIQMQLLKRVRRAGKPTVVVLFNGGVVGAEELILHTDGVVEAFYPGFFGAQAVSDILFGDAIPSGKLPVTMYPSNYVTSVDMKSMSMTKYPGRSYRYYKEVPVFPFGWGLSYTRFTMALDSSSGVTDPSEPIVVTRQLDQTVTVILSNDGNLVGDEVVFAFFRPLKVNATGNAALLNEQLFDYRRVSLRPTQYRKLKFRIQQSTLAMVDDSGNQASFPGFYEVIITNGVHERVTFAIHLVGEFETLSVFPTDTGYVPPSTQSENTPIHLDAMRAFEGVPARPTDEKQPEAAVALAFD
ncbi:glycoside hydrolase, putative [Phytophthora infestans T30-4]|uniref:Glycoside hydrolase, putative n=1 Tax=Phytophthora infestans (strain T30-4) TaxID=403677 RepID=D0MVH5_PHYIT|nr:glycoside hydrolase, putative [Phytophthora infestans T30-4]EEY63638.1 glycoside hydrolase, putative [Phytophthora infestans T30-4]|eukprot:XP_002907074.1 glycoside hydrolase, putative [Phytophthora infestans T30-4]